MIEKLLKILFEKLQMEIGVFLKKGNYNFEKSNLMSLGLYFHAWALKFCRYVK